MIKTEKRKRTIYQSICVVHNQKKNQKSNILNNCKDKFKISMDNSPLAIKEEVVDTTDLIFEEHENDSTGDQTGDQTEAHTEAQPEDQIEIKIEEETENQLISEENALSDDKFVEVHEAKSDSDPGNENDPFDNLENHETKNVENTCKTIEMFKCETCDIGFSKQGELKYHNGLVHTLQCYLCEQKFDSKKDLIKHFANERTHKHFSKEGKPVNEKGTFIHVKAPKKPYKCNFCDKAYAHPGSLQKHTIKVHEKELEAEKKLENESKEKLSARDSIECRFCEIEMPKESMPLHLDKCDIKKKFISGEITVEQLKERAMQKMKQN